MPKDGNITRNKILDVAQMMVLNVGLSGTSIEKVIESADVAKGTFFYHFKTKNDLAAALLERFANEDEQHYFDAMDKAEQLARDPLAQLLIFLGLFIEKLEQLEEPFPGCLYASYCYQSGAVTGNAMSKIERMIKFWRKRLSTKIEEVVINNPPRIPIENHQVADHVLATFEGAFILAKVLKEPKLASEQLIQCRNYMELLFKTENGKC
jgi:TetR/AcrR family transcriptional repressor of nem operon